MNRAMSEASHREMRMRRDRNAIAAKAEEETSLARQLRSAEPGITWGTAIARAVAILTGRTFNA